MTQDAFDILSTVIRSSWYVFTSWYLPGTHTTPGSMALFLLTAYVTLRFFKRIAKVEDSSMDDK